MKTKKNAKQNVHAETIPGMDAVMITDGHEVLTWSHGRMEERWVSDAVAEANSGGAPGRWNSAWNEAVWEDCKKCAVYKCLGFGIHRLGNLPSGLPLVCIDLPFSADGGGQTIFVLTGKNGKSTTRIPAELRREIRANWYQNDWYHTASLPVDQKFVDALCAE